MPKSYYGRNNGFKKRYVPQERRMATVRRPLASKYGDELYIKVQKVVQLETLNQNGDVYAYMRQDLAASNPAAGQWTLGDQNEFVPFLPLYGSYEVVGMKAEMTCADSARVTGSGLYAGLAPGLNAIPGTPNNESLVQLPIQTKGNTQGQVFTAYYAFSKDLKRQGAQFSIPTNTAYVSNIGVMVARLQLGSSPAIGTKVGEVKFTWFVRMSTRRLA